MCFADATIPQLDIVGPPGLTHFLAAMRSYTFRYAHSTMVKILIGDLSFRRDTMPIYPTEASWVSSTSASPDPLYKDKIITVYGIPILPCSETPRNTSPTSDSSTFIDSPAQILKRKRDTSPDSPSKRPALMTEENQPLGKPQSLNEIMQQADFTPVELAGETAQEWRRLMVDVMFPGVKPKMDAEKQKHRKERDRDSAPSRSKKSGDNNADASVASNENSKSTKTEAQTCDNNGPTPPHASNGPASTSPSNVSILLPSGISLHQSFIHVDRYL